MPGRLLLLLAVAAAAVAAAALAPREVRADNPVLVADVGAGDAYTIGLADAQGRPVTHLDPGTYTLLVHDHSALHNFDLFGPGVSARTDVAAIGDFTFTITVSDGLYRFVCDAHPTIMKGSFTAGTASSPPPPKPRPARLTATVGPGATIALRPLAGLKAGPATIVVRDRSARDNFRLVGPGISKATGVAFRGTVTWKVRLRPGRYVFRSDRHRALRRSFTVAPAGS